MKTACGAADATSVAATRAGVATTATAASVMTTRRLVDRRVLERLSTDIGTPLRRRRRGGPLLRRLPARSMSRCRVRPFADPAVVPMLQWDPFHRAP